MLLSEAHTGHPAPLSAPHHSHDVRLWALILLLGIATLVAGYILWAKVSGF